jgi:peptide/nickel transport system ATP-binding protein
VKTDHRTKMPILEIRDLAISYETRKGGVEAVRQVSCEVHRATTFGIVGESGCGKSTVAFGIVDFLGPNGKIVGGSIKFQGQELGGDHAGAERDGPYPGLDTGPAAGG